MPISLNSLYRRGLSTLRRRWVPAAVVFASILGGSAIYISQKSPIYRVEGHIIYEQENKALSLVGLSSLAKNLTQGGGWGDADLAIETEKRIILSKPILQNVLDELQSQYPKKTFPNLKAIKHLAKTISIPSTKIIRIEYDSNSPATAQLIVNQLMDVYVQHNLDRTRETYAEARKFIISQLPEYKRRVFLAEAALRAFKEKDGMLNLQSQNQYISTNLARIDERLDQVEARIENLRSESRNLQKKLGITAEEALAITTTKQSPTLQDSQNNIQELEKKLADANALYQSSHPHVLELKNKLRKARILLQSNIPENVESFKTRQIQVGEAHQELISTLINAEIEIDAHVQEKNQLGQQRLKYENQASRLPIKEQRLREMQRELSLAEANYKTLNKNLQDLLLSERQTVSNARVLEPAQTSLLPISPNKTMTMLTASLIGATLALCTICFLEISDNRINRIEELRAVFAYPLLATIPSFESLKADSQTQSSSIILSQQNFPVTEGYRILQSNIKFSQPDHPVRVIVMTSSIPSEGKSTTSSNLAVTSAQMGQSVLLIDGDLRRPSQHQLWEVPNTVGMSNILADPEIEIASALQDVNEGVDMITAGILPPNPQVLLDSQRMKYFIEQMSNHYDLMIIDAPPLSVAADAAILGKMADGILLVARPGVVNRNSATLSQEILQQSNINILGLVINGGKPDFESDSYYYYYSNPYYNV